MIHTARITSAEVKMVNFIDMHNLSFQAADHLSNLLLSMFPDSAIAADFACRQHHEFILDSNVVPEEECDEVNFWLKISQAQSPMGE